MANTPEKPHDDRWVDERLNALDAREPFRANEAHARARLQARLNQKPHWPRSVWLAAAIAGGVVILLTLPWPRAAAQRLWDRLTLGRVEIVQVSREDLPKPFDPFQWKEEEGQRQPVRDAAEAERLAGFHPLLPPAGVLKGAPQLAVSDKLVISSPPLKVAEVQRALAAAGVSDVSVPRAWEGAALRIEVGPTIYAEYPEAGMGLSQSAPFKLVTPAGFPVGQYVEIAYRLYGKGASDARDLSRKFVANPAWMLVFPGHDTVREVGLRSGGTAVAAGGQGMCFFWSTPDRIFIIGAQKMDPEMGVTVANSVR